ncbi:hypothetical protein Cgig2_016201 [Carnegiea gigantea]|uniref:Uncharacterized protein n=1 Tax=Carnegiea gigantea TaxID=171969 RepID=A0A9Q1KLW2_9CARY|nr:hypothetical protein Cgig2_028185 [Carnegiea gigantea]KAJ8446891.1 hypothetical protein Cgig2_016201 [Carnegiea gigantea]
MVERDGIVEAFDINPTSAPNYTPPTTYFISDNVTDVRYDGWTDETHLFVLHCGVAAAHFEINYTSLEELNSIIYDIYARTTRSNAEFADGVAQVSTEEVHVFVWNCRGIARASFRPNLFTILSLTYDGVVVLTDTRAACRNARQLLDKAHGLEYFYVEPLGFVGGLLVLWDTSKVVLGGINGEDNFVSFAMKLINVVCVVCCTLCLFRPTSSEGVLVFVAACIFKIMSRSDTCYPGMTTVSVVVSMVREA